MCVMSGLSAQTSGVISMYTASNDCHVRELCAFWTTSMEALKTKIKNAGDGVQVGIVLQAVKTASASLQVLQAEMHRPIRLDVFSQVIQLGCLPARMQTTLEILSTWNQKCQDACAATCENVE